MRTHHRLFTTGAALICAAGLATTAVAQTGTLPTRDNETRHSANAPYATYHLARCSEIKGVGVHGPNNDEIGSVSDLVVARSSGHIMYAVVKTGDILGLGGKTVAIPFSSFAWNEADDHFTLNMTKEQLQAQPEFTPEYWTNLHKPDSALRRWLTKDIDERYRNDRDNTPIRVADAKDVRGKVVSVERVAYGPHGEDVIVVVRTQDGAQERVLLGPTWYVMGSPAAPMRDDDVVVTVVRHDGPATWVATRAEIDGQKIQLRGDRGEPSWTGDSPATKAMRDQGPGARLALVSDIKGADVRCRGESCGEVDDVLIDTVSGRALLLSIDPDENFLGIADTKRLVPWSIATLGFDGTVNVDADKTMVTNSVETPDDLDGYRTGAALRPVYDPFQVSVPRAGFERNDYDRGEMPKNNSTNNRDPDRRR